MEKMCLQINVDGAIDVECLEGKSNAMSCAVLAEGGSWSTCSQGLFRNKKTKEPNMPDTDLLEMMKDCFSPLIKSFNQNTEDIDKLQKRLITLERMVGEMQCTIQADYTEKIESIRQLIKSNSNDFGLVRDVIQDRITALEEAKKCSCKDSSDGSWESVKAIEYNTFKRAYIKLNKIYDAHREWEYKSENSPVSDYESINGTFIIRLVHILNEKY